MRGVYTATIAIDALDSAKTLILLGANSRTCLELLGASLTNRSSETNEQYDCAVTRLATADTDIDQGTPITPTKSEEGDAASSSTCTGNFTLEPGSYESVNIDREGVPGLSGYHYEPLPEDRTIISPGEYVGLRIIAAPSSFNALAKFKWREIGG